MPQTYTKVGGVWTAIQSVYTKSGGTWVAIKAIYTKVAGVWQSVFGQSVVTAIIKPYITDTASGTNTITGFVNIGDNIYGRNGTWNANGYTISSYTYTWNVYPDKTTASPTSVGTGTIIQGGITGAKLMAVGYDNKFIQFLVTANTTPSSANGNASSLSTSGYLAVIKKIPTVTTTISFNNSTPSLDSTITATVAYNNTDIYSLDHTRSTAQWYKVDTSTLVETAISNAINIDYSTYLADGKLKSTYAPLLADSVVGYKLKVVFSVRSSYTDYINGIDIPNTTSSITALPVVVSSPPSPTNGTVTYSRTNASYLYSITSNGTWSGTPNMYKYQWYEKQFNLAYYTYVPITGATSSTFDASLFKPTLTTVAYITPVVWASNDGGLTWSTTGYALQDSNGTNIATSAGGNKGPDVLVLYKDPVINSFSVTGGERQISYVSDFLVDDPTATKVLSWTGSASGSINLTLATATGTVSLAAGTYNFTLTVSNVSSFATVSTKTSGPLNRTVTNFVTYQFAMGNTLYHGTNGYISLDQGNSGVYLSPSGNRQLSIYNYDLI